MSKIRKLKTEYVEEEIDKRVEERVKEITNEKCAKMITNAIMKNIGD